MTRIARGRLSQSSRLNSRPFLREKLVLENVQIEPDQESPADGRIQGAVRILPSWLVSMICHLAVLLLLALMTIASRPEQSTSFTLDMAEAASFDGSAFELALDDELPQAENVSEELSKTVEDRVQRPEDVAVLFRDDEIKFEDAALEEGFVKNLSAADLAGIDALAEARNVGKSGATGASFFGLHASGNRFVFIVDSSYSMVDKIDDCARELESALRRLEPQQRFYVIFFDNDAELMCLGPWDEKKKKYRLRSRPEKDLAAATDQNIGALMQWVKTVELQAWTNPSHAVRFTFENLEADAIFLLSDGELNDRGATESYLFQHNLIESPYPDRPKIPIHTIGFYSKLGEVALKRIAKEHGGKYSFVPPPDGAMQVGPFLFKPPAIK